MTFTDRSLLRIAVVSLCAALLVAGTSLVLGSRADYLDHLPLFNTLAITMLTLGVMAVVISVVGLCKGRLRSMPLAITGTVALLFVIRLMLDG